jgi:hypothetical protein
MKLACIKCGKSVSNEIPEGTIVRAICECPECLEKSDTTMLDEEWKKEPRAQEMARLLVECRDALPAISLVSARLHNISPTLADRVEAVLKPWKVEDQVKE